MGKSLIITEKKLIAKDLARSGSFGNPTSFKIHDNLYYENENYIIAPCQGHLFEKMKPREVDEKHGFLFKKDENYDYAALDLLPKAKLKKKKSAIKIINMLEKVLARNDIDEIIYSGDADAEGEAIVRHAVEMLSKNLSKHIKHTRLYNTGSFDSKAVIDKAYKERLPINSAIYENLYTSRECRADADYYAMAFCKVYTDKTGMVVRYGRVKSALLSMVCNREYTIKNFKPRDYSNVRVFIGENIKDKDALKFMAFREEEIIDEMGVKKKEHSGQFFADAEVNGEKIVNDVKQANYTGVVTENRTYETSSRKPLLYNLNEFNADFMGLYNVNAEYSEECIEFLRFKEYVTYTRTDGNYYPTLEIDKVKELQETCVAQYTGELNNMIGQDPQFKVKPVTTDLELFNDAKAAKQNHTPIVILKPLSDSDYKFLKQPQKSHDKGITLKHLIEAYELVATRCMIQFLPDDKVKKQNLEIEIGGHKFETSTEMTVYDGWKALDKNANKAKGKEIKFEFNVGDTIKVDGVDIENHKTKAPPRLTESNLFKACVNVKQVLTEEINAIEDETERKKRMERYAKTVKLFDSAKGIGTQGTLKGIFGEMKDDGFFAFEGKYLVPTAKGMFIHETVHPYLSSLELTAIMESYLIDVRAGHKTQEQFNREFIEGILAPIARKEAERNIKMAPREISPKMLKYVEAISKKLSLPMPNIKDYSEVQKFIEDNKEAYEAQFNKAPDYIVKTFKANQDKIPTDVYSIIEKESITKDEYKKLMEVFKTLPKTYDSFLESIVAVIMKNSDKFDSEIIDIVKNNKPTPDEYQKVMVALNNLKRSFSEKQLNILNENKDKLSKKVQTLLDSKSEFNKEEYALIKKELDKLFQSDKGKSSSKSKK